MLTPLGMAAKQMSAMCSAQPNVRFWPMLLKKSASDTSGRSPRVEARRRCRSGGGRLWPPRDQLGELPEVLGGSCEVELVTRAVRAAYSETVEPEDAFEVCAQHLDLLALAPGG